MNYGSDRIPPQDLESEQSLLGSMMLSKDAVSMIVGKIKAEHFYKQAHSHIFTAILTLFNDDKPADLVTVSNELKKAKVLDVVGGRSALIDIIDSVPTAANAEVYAGIVFEKAMLRGLINTSAEIMKDSYDPSSEALHVLDAAQQKIGDLSKQGVKDNFVSIKDAVNVVFEQIQNSGDSDDKLIGISTGYPDLDKMSSGFQAGDLIILAARPSMGKTTLALNFAQKIAINNNQGVAVFSCEMPAEQLAMRLLCSEAKIDSGRLRTANIKDHEYRDLNQAFGKLSEAPIYIDDTPNLSPLELKAKCRRLQSEVDIKFIVIDYMQLLRSSKKRVESRYHEVSEIVRDVKAFAKESRLPILALSQLSRDIEKRQDKRPLLSDLRESGEIEQTADLIMFLHRPEDFQASDEFSNVDLIIAKHRNGPTGDINLGFRKQISTFVSVSKKIEPVPQEV
ncbi:replicative DNA helicase [Candidatus Marinamargulisbacteria bacterium SCGC AG-414-C22]|nr:replicative DNA helicase [Candidatus Marinamargulisbacteria bacterium SCGC AG-414-C22]